MLVLIVILLVFALLFNICACVDLRYIGGEFSYSVKYLFIEILSSDRPKKKKEKKEKKSKKKKKKAESEIKEEDGKESCSD